MENQELVLLERQDGIAIVTLNRPSSLNALSISLRNRLAEIFKELASDGKTKVVILTGSGRAFTVGLDLKELGGEIEASGKIESDVAQAMSNIQVPIIGAINGYAITGGFEIALMCDFLIGTPNAKFADTHARVGVVPGWGLSQRLPRIIGVNRARELSLTGNFLDAETACSWGLLNRIVEEEELIAHCSELARDIISTDEATRTEMRRIINAGWESTLSEGLIEEKNANRDHGKREVRPEKVAARRNKIQERGRSQAE